MITDGTHQQALQTQIRGNTFKNLSNNLSILKMRSSSLEFLKSDNKQEILYLKNEDRTKIKTSGFSLPWFLDPRPALCKSLNSMLQANTSIDRVMSSIQTLTNSIPLINDGANLVLQGASYMPNIVMGMANKMASFSIGTTTKVEVTKRSIPVPNTMKGEILNVKNRSTDLKGSFWLEGQELYLLCFPFYRHMNDHLVIHQILLTKTISMYFFVTLKCRSNVFIW